MVTIERVRYFLSVAQTLSFSQTAKDCYVSQTAVSQQIAQLERELGVTLFFRQNKKVCLTPAGKHLLPMAEKLYDDYIAMISDMERTYRRPDNLTLAISGNYEAQLLAVAIPTFRELFPDTVILAKKLPMEQVIRSFEEGAFDLVFALTGDFESKDALSIEVLHGVMGVAVSVNHPFAARRSILTTELPRYPFVLPRNKPGLKAPAQMLAWVRALGCDENDILWADTIEEQQFMVSVNQGISILPDYIISPGVRVLPMEDAQVPYSISVYYRRRTAELDKLIELIVDAGNHIAENP